MFNFEAYFPTRMLVGNKSIDAFPEQARNLGSKAMLVTGKESMKRSGYTDRVIRNLKAVGIETVLFDEVQSNPTRQTVNDGGKLARKEKVEMVVGLGGGSALDAAKGIAVLGKYGGDIWDFVKGKKITEPVLPIIALPSTAGTGSEATLYAVISDDEARAKDGFMSEFIFTSIAVIDPELMSTTPASLTAKAGADALAQAIESYLTKRAHPYSDMLALESLRLCSAHLRTVVQDGMNLQSRAAMGWASSLAGIAISLVDVVIGHHVSEAVGAIYHTHHGETAAVLLPYAMEFNFEGTKDRLARIAKVLGIDTSKLSLDEAARRAIEAVRELLKQIGIPERLSALGVQRSAIPEILNILKNRTPDLEAGNYHEISIKSMREYIERTL